MSRAFLVILLVGNMSHHSDTLAAMGFRQGHATISERSREAEALCSRIKEIKRLPFRNEGPAANYDYFGEVYAGLRKLAGKAAPCLIERIADTARMPDPRQAPTVASVAVGDVAFWILADITDLPYDEMFPSELRERFRSEGVYAYFDWVKKKKNRRLLQKNVRSWYLNEYRDHPK